MLELEPMDVGLLALDGAGRIVSANRWLLERARLEQPLAGRSLGEVWGEQLDPSLVRAVRECLDSGHSVHLSQAFHPMPLPIFAPGVDTGERLRQRVDVIALMRGNGLGRHCVLRVHDVSEMMRREQWAKKQAQHLNLERQRNAELQAQVERQSLRLREVERLAPVGLFETDLQGRISYCNERGAQMLALDPDAPLGKPWFNTLPDEDLRRILPKWQAATQSSVRFAEEVCVESADRSTRWLRVEAGPLREGDPAGAGLIGTVIDVTEFHDTARRNEYRAHHDPLTGLANRERFVMRLSGAIAAAPPDQPGGPVVLFIDLDHFQQVNELHGHEAGDSVLRTVAKRLHRAVRRDDLVARMGGDEFAVLLEDAPDRDAVERIVQKLVQAVGMGIPIGGGQVRVACSVGVASSPLNGASANELLRHADMDRYAQKHEPWVGDQVLAIV